MHCQLKTILHNVEVLITKAHTNKQEDPSINQRDAVFIFELIYVLEEFSKILVASGPTELPHPAYITEKLHTAKKYLDAAYEYFNLRKEIESEKNR